MSLDDSLELQNLEQLEDVIEQAVGLLNAASGGIYQFDPMQEELTLVSSFPSNTIDESLFGAVLKLGEGIAGNLILSEERYYCVPDYANWPGRSSQFGSETFSSVIEMRLEHNHERLGIFYINDNRVERVYTEKDIELLRVCSNYASMILYDLKRLAQESYQRNRLEKLLKTNRKVMSDLSVSEVTNWRERLDQIIDSVAQLLEAETGGFFVVEGDELVQPEVISSTHTETD
jgi:GAF domain-containing protein